MSTSRRKFILTAVLAPLGVAAAKFLPAAPLPSVAQNIWPPTSGLVEHVHALIKADMQQFIGRKLSPMTMKNIVASTNNVLKRLEQEQYIAQAGIVNATGTEDGTVDVTATFRPTQSLLYVSSTFTIVSK